MDPRGALYDLEPPFPALSAESRDQYWARNYAIIEPEVEKQNVDAIAWRVVTLNSAAFDGYSGPTGPELEHGRISPRTARRLRADLEKRPPATVNLMLVHHHLHQLPNIDTQEQSMIADVELLTQILDDFHPWMVVHGHKHRARIFFGGGEAYTTIFAAGSLSAFSYGVSAGAAIPNQAYIVDFADLTVREEYDFGVAGTFEAFEWVPDQGWKMSTAGHDMSLPGRGGFGWRTTPANTARKIATSLRNGRTKLTRDELIAAEPRLQYLSPTGLSKLAASLRERSPSINLERDEYGRVSEASLLITPDESPE